MFHNIVVGCSESDASSRAIELAEKLRAPDGRLILTNVFPFYRGFAAPVTPVLYAEWLKDEACQTLAAAAGRVSVGVPFETQAVAAPSAAAGINDVAEMTNADLIVLGTTHRTAVGRFAGRATVQRLLHGAPCAVAVAPEDGTDRWEGRPRIVVAYDGTPESILARDAAYAIAADTAAEVELCAVIEPMMYSPGYAPAMTDVAVDKEREQHTGSSLADAADQAPASVPVTTRFAWGPPTSKLLELTGDDAALLVAGSRGYGTVHRAFAGAVSGALLVNGTIPVLVLPRATSSTDINEPAAGAALEV